MNGFTTTDWKPRHRILVIDPGWENLGVFLLEISDSQVKKYRAVAETIDLELKKGCDPEEVVTACNTHFCGEGLFLPGDDKYSIDYLIMERQPAKWLQNRELEIALRVFLYQKYNIAVVMMYSPITVKNKLDLPTYRNDHSRNKKAMIEKISEGEDILFRGVYNEHIADCVGLLNVFLQTHKTLRTKVIEYKEEFVNCSESSLQ